MLADLALLLLSIVVTLPGANAGVGVGYVSVLEGSNLEEVGRGGDEEVEGGGGGDFEFEFKKKRRGNDLKK
jgi:hypothetical protein